MKHITGNNIAEFLANTPQLTFEITEKCNLSCVYCGYGRLYNNKDPRQGRELSIDNAIALLDYLKKLWDAGYNSQGKSNLIVSFYGGEPLLNMTFIRAVIEYIETNMLHYGKKFIYSMTTNAVLLAQNMDYLVEKDFLVLISLDGDEKGDSLRVFNNGTQSFSHVTHQISQMRGKYPDFFESNVSFNSVLSNRTSVKSITDYIYNTYHKIPSISEINTDGINPAEQKLLDSIFLDKWESNEINKSVKHDDYKLDPAFDRIAHYMLMISPYVYHDYNELLFNSQNKRKEIPTGTCMPFAKKVFLTVSGNIMPCERIGYKYNFGSVIDGEVHMDFDKIAHAYNSYYDKVNKTCSKCSNKKGCLACMFNNGQLDSVSAKCKHFVTSREDKLKKSEAVGFFMKYPEAYSYIMNNYEILV